MRNFTSPKSRIQAVNQIHTSARAGLPVRDSPKTIDNLLVKWEISHARHACGHEPRQQLPSARATTRRASTTVERSDAVESHT